VPAPLEVLTQEQKEERLKYIMNKLRETPDPSFVNFIGRCLEWDPKIRLTPEEGLMHEWIVSGLPPNIVLHNPDNNPYARNKNSSSAATNKNLKTDQSSMN
jgi:serine/threonine protein kinase